MTSTLKPLCSTQMLRFAQPATRIFCRWRAGQQHVAGSGAPRRSFAWHAMFLRARARARAQTHTHTHTRTCAHKHPRGRKVSPTAVPANPAASVCSRGTMEVHWECRVCVRSGDTEDMQLHVHAQVCTHVQCWCLVAASCRGRMALLRTTVVAARALGVGSPLRLFGQCVCVLWCSVQLTTCKSTFWTFT